MSTWLLSEICTLSIYLYRSICYSYFIPVQFLFLLAIYIKRIVIIIIYLLPFFYYYMSVYGKRQTIGVT